MRSYPRNSPQAAARILGLVLVSDGHVSRTEYESLNQLLDAHDLGLEPQALTGIVQTLCEDLLMEGFDGRAMLTHVGDGSVATLLAEVDDARLQAQVLRMAASAAHADKHLSDGETAMFDAVIRHWQVSPLAVDAAGARLIPPALAPAGSA